MCNLPVVVTAYLRKYGNPDSTDESEGGTHQSTFGWRVASRKTGLSGGTGTSATQQSDTAMDVTTVNLRDFSTNTQMGTGTIHERTVALPQLAGTDSVRGEEDDIEDDEAPARTGRRQQKSIVWLTPGTESKDQEDEK